LVNRRGLGCERRGRLEVRGIDERVSGQHGGWTNLAELYPNRLKLEIAFHGNAAEKLANRGLIAIAQRMELPLVTSNGLLRRASRPSTRKLFSGECVAIG
jgi:hypothetical protein